MISVYFGSDTGLVSYTAKKAVIKACLKEELQNVTKYDGFKDQVSDLVDDLSSLSLFGEKKIIVFSNAYFLSDAKKKEKGAIKEKDQDYKSLLSALEGLGDETDLFFLVPGKIDSKNEIILLLKSEAADFVLCENPSNEDLIGMAMRKAKEENKDIDREGASLLVDYCQGDYLLFVNSLEKLLTYTDRVRADDVKLLVHKPLENNIFEIVSSLLSNNVPKALRFYRDLRKGGNDPLGLLPAFVTQFRFLALARYLIEEGYNDDKIAFELSGKGTKVNPKRLYFARRETRYISYDTLIDVLVELGEIEEGIKIKGDNGDERLELFISLFQSKYLRAR